MAIRINPNQPGMQTNQAGTALTDLERGNEKLTDSQISHDLSQIDYNLHQAFGAGNINQAQLNRLENDLNDVITGAQGGDYQGALDKLAADLAGQFVSGDRTTFENANGGANGAGWQDNPDMYNMGGTPGQPPDGSTPSTSSTISSSGAGPGGDAGATQEPSIHGGPNGSQSWMNQGIDGGGWNPPTLNVNDIKTISPDEFVQKFPVMAQFQDAIKQGLQDNGLPVTDQMVTLAMSIAMEESDGNPNAGGPTPGLFQVDPGNYKNGQDPNSLQGNIDAGLGVLASGLQSSGGNILVALGGYNGWQPGLTSDQMQHPPWGGEPMNQNYLQQVLNGWAQGIDGYQQTPGDFGDT